MERITIDLELIRKHGLTINEYLTLYNIACPGCIDNDYIPRSSDLTKLEKKGYVKIMPEGVILREKTNDFFGRKTDYFLKWLNAYPIRVRRSNGGSRVLSPASDETIEGRKLRKKWDTMFRGKPHEEEKAILVLEAEVKMRKKSNDLEFMVEAARWLNGGYHEKYAYLLEEAQDVNGQGIVEDYSEDWN